MPNTDERGGMPDDEDAELLALEELLSVAEDDQQKEIKSIPQPHNDDAFLETFSYDLGDGQKSAIEKELRAGRLVNNAVDQLDSSDDEEVQKFLERKYNEYGNDISKKLKEQRETEREEAVKRDIDHLEKQTNGENSLKLDSNIIHIKNPHNPINRRSLVSQSFKKPPTEAARNVSNVQNTLGTSNGRAQHILNRKTGESTVFIDPVFGLRMVNPLVSSSLLLERMAERKAIAFSGIVFHIQHGDLSKDWVIAGVLVYKCPIKVSKKGDPYSIWRLSDLKGDIKMISLFLFQKAHKELWKTTTGTCLAILNPTVFESRASNGEIASLSIDTPQKVMILGTSKDLGVCKAKKKNGEPCTATVNVSECDYCVYHVKQEFSRMSMRSELQSPNAGRGLNELRNKILGKCEVFYGGRSYTAVPAKRSTKQTAKDSNRLMSLSDYANSPNAANINHTVKPKTWTNEGVPYATRDGPVSKVAANVEASNKQRLKDIERLKSLRAELEIENPAENHNTGNSNSKSPIVEKNTLNRGSDYSNCSTKSAPTKDNALPELDKFKDRSFSFELPKLSREGFNIEVNINEHKMQAAKLKAAQLIKGKPLLKANPNSLRGTKEGKRRAIDDLHDRLGNPSKRNKIEEDQKEIERKSRIQRIMEATSSHSNLIDMREQEEKEKYFNKLEKKEALEEKMLNTYKISCKAVSCLQCKYTAFSAADRCKTEGHSLKVIDGEKRFYKCKDCGNRTTTLFKLPKISCNNCSSSRWERAPMIRERKIDDGSQNLSLRGDEEAFLGSLKSKIYLDLLVPEE